jgi:Protein of unknown function (DUF995)
MRTVVLCAVMIGAVGGAAAQGEAATLRDLEGKSPRKLSKDELTQLLTGAKMSRVAPSGNSHLWTNEAGGSFVISSDNRGGGAQVRSAGRPSTATGKWHISDDGRYCVLIEWKSVATEEWCRYLLQTSDGYYAVRSESVGTEKVYKLEIGK